MCFIRILQHMLFDHKQFVWTQHGLLLMHDSHTRFVQMRHAYECIGRMTYTYDIPYIYIVCHMYIRENPLPNSRVWGSLRTPEYADGTNTQISTTFG